MAQLFHRSTNAWSKASIFGALVIVGAVVFVVDQIYKSPYVNQRNVTREQPVPFSHQHHVKGLGIDCRYCHTSAEESSFAGIPPVKTCMTCHSQIWTNSEMLAPIREAYRTGQPLKWVRVHDLPDYVYFDHSIHVAKGVACTTCHGPVGDMPLMSRRSTLHMKWCLECHKHPENFVGRKEDVFKLHPTPLPEDKDEAEFRQWLVKENKVKKVTDCYACHR